MPDVFKKLVRIKVFVNPRRFFMYLSKIVKALQILFNSCFVGHLLVNLKLISRPSFLVGTLLYLPYGCLDTHFDQF